jgi:hypothetical protein
MMDAIGNLDKSAVSSAKTKASFRWIEERIKGEKFCIKKREKKL